jgi:proteasome lid subunit RPN8/RPN11
MGIAARARDKTAGAHPVICIFDAILSRRHLSSSNALQIHPSIWSEARRRQREDWVSVVGWFHSHPQRGAFFSRTDRQTQRRLFHREYSIGYVVDPAYNAHAFFLGPNALDLARHSVLVVENMTRIMAAVRQDRRLQEMTVPGA